LYLSVHQCIKLEKWQCSGKTSHHNPQSTHITDTAQNTSSSVQLAYMWQHTELNLMTLKPRSGTLYTIRPGNTSGLFFSYWMGCLQAYKPQYLYGLWTVNDAVSAVDTRLLMRNWRSLLRVKQLSVVFQQVANNSNLIVSPSHTGLSWRLDTHSSSSSSTNKSTGCHLALALASGRVAEAVYVQPNKQPQHDQSGW